MMARTVATTAHTVLGVRTAISTARMLKVLALTAGPLQPQQRHGPNRAHKAVPGIDAGAASVTSSNLVGT